MRDIDILAPLPGKEKSVVTLGKFDGIHRGHQKLIEQVHREKGEGMVSLICVFDTGRQMLFTKEERRKILDLAGMDYLAECELTGKLRQMKAEEFVKNILHEQMRAAKVVVGEDFRFGFERKGSVALLKKLGAELDFQVDVIPKEMDGSRKISSTYIREQLNEGNMENVSRLLGRNFHTTGEVLHGRGLGHRKLMPTTNLIPSREKLMPPNGVYLTEASFGNRKFNGITNVGYKPTVGGESFLGVETYLLDCNEDLYGQQSSVEFLKFLRPEQQFSSLEALKSQLMKDIARGKQYFAR